MRTGLRRNGVRGTGTAAIARASGRDGAGWAPAEDRQGAPAAPHRVGFRVDQDSVQGEGGGRKGTYRGGAGRRRRRWI